ncbi:MAG: DNA translocase FtsK [Clostridium sp.]|nr:DNA translocase FtsK [Clostridium sp.]
MLAIGIMILLSLVLENSIGVFGIFVKKNIMGFVGLPGYLTPFILIIYSVSLIFKKNIKQVKTKLLYISGLLSVIAAMLQTFYYNQYDYINMSFWGYIKKFYADGIIMRGGGILGGILSIPFLLIFKNLGTIIILTTVAIIHIILITDVSIADIFIKSKNYISQLLKGFESKFKMSKEEIKKEIIKENGIEEIDIGMNEKAVLKLGELPDDGLEVNGAWQKTEEAEELTYNHSDEISYENQEQQTNGDGEPSKGRNIPHDQTNNGIFKHPQENDPFVHTPGYVYEFPPIKLLNKSKQNPKKRSDHRAIAMGGAKKLEMTLKSFGVDAKVINVGVGPAVTRYELQPSPGVKVSKIVNLSDDISLNLAAAGVRIEAPIPGKAAVGIEVPNKEVTPVFLRDVLDSEEFRRYESKLAFALGKDISGRNMIADIAKMPHMLVAGATGSGKSVCINSLIMSILFKASPDEVKLLLVDPKVVELGIYNGIPHLLIPVVTDPQKAAGALNWAVQEMVNRYKLFADAGVRDLGGYNAVVSENGETDPLPHVVIIIDELADLMMAAPRDVEDAICRLAQMARAAGMHLVIATQRPSVDVITGVIKANIPSRIAFSVSSQVDSRTIIDMSGAEKLLGKGDMLFYPVGEPKPIRVKGAFVTDKEVERVIGFIKSNANPEYNEDIIDEINSGTKIKDSQQQERDELLPQVIEMVVESGQASVSLIQRKFRVGYARAARIVDQMEERGIVGEFEGSKPRQVLITKLQLQEMNMKNNE